MGDLLGEIGLLRNEKHIGGRVALDRELEKIGIAVDHLSRLVNRNPRIFGLKELDFLVNSYLNDTLIPWMGGHRSRGK